MPSLGFTIFPSHFFLTKTKTAMLKEFRAFLMRGNVVDLAIAVIIAAAFGAIVTSLVDDIITPLLLQPALKAAGAEDINQLSVNGIKYGNFLAAIIKFVVIGFVLFLIVKSINKMNRKPPLTGGQV